MADDRHHAAPEHHLQSGEVTPGLIEDDFRMNTITYNDHPACRALIFRAFYHARRPRPSGRYLMRGHDDKIIGQHRQPPAAAHGMLSVMPARLIYDHAAFTSPGRFMYRAKSHTPYTSKDIEASGHCHHFLVKVRHAARASEHRLIVAFHAAAAAARRHAGPDDFDRLFLISRKKMMTFVRLVDIIH